MPVPPRLLALVLLLSPLVCAAWPFSFHRAVRQRRDAPAYYDPKTMNGSLLTLGFLTFPAGLGEPLNAIVSGHSDPDVLKDQEVKGGLRNYFLSLSFSAECLGQHLGSDQAANLGDGNGPKNESAVLRYNYGDPALGSCKETVQGGNHIRYWVQDGPKANSGAVFLAVSYEKPIKEGHDIIFNGYNLGRDWIVGNITGSSIQTAELTNTSSYKGTTQSEGYTYETTVNYTGGILQATNDGVNHFASVGGGPDNITAIDGLVAVLTIKITGRPQNSSATGVNYGISSQKAGYAGLFLFTLGSLFL